MRLAAIRLVATLVAVAAPAGAQEAFDVLIRGGRVFDGSGNPWVRADVGLRGDRIAAVGELSRATASRVIDAGELYVAPGFIDTHTHAGPGLATAALSPALPLLAQGVTTAFVNPDGGGPVDLAAQRTGLLRHGLGVNVAQLVPHGSVREAVLGMQDRLANAEELGRMQELVRRGMAEGAFGLSSGPFYAPGSYSDTAELIALARVAAQAGGAYQSHVRDESSYTIGVLAAVDEVIAVARGARLPSVVTHVKALGQDVWGFSTAIALRIQAARDEGLEVWADQYPYEASATGLAPALLPRWAQAGGAEALRSRLRDAGTRSRIRAEAARNLERRGGASRIRFRRLPADPAFAGRTLGDLARAKGQQPVDVALELLETGSPGIVSFAMFESDVRSLMRQPWTLTASDGELVPFGEGVPHPRGYGTFARKLRRYALDEGVVGLEQALRSMTSLPAAVYRIEDRGVLRPGAYADLVVFDPARVRDRATYAEPHQLAEGMLHVFVNGRPALRDGAPTEERAGRVLRRDAP
ncbi:MAG: amidohydrolase family protein [Vicinamibacteria bacterium]